jgi:hypothetical protein
MVKAWAERDRRIMYVPGTWVCSRISPSTLDKYPTKNSHEPLEEKEKEGKEEEKEEGDINLYISFSLSLFSPFVSSFFFLFF